MNHHSAAVQPSANTTREHPATRSPAAADPRPWALALIRWSLGMLFLLFGIGKLTKATFFMQNYILTPLEPSGLPKWLLIAFGYAMPPLEILLGALLLLGLARNPVLFATALYLAILLFGQILFTLGYGQLLLVQSPLVASNFLYLVVTLALLYLHEHDRWVLRRRKVHCLS